MRQHACRRPDASSNLLLCADYANELDARVFADQDCPETVAGRNQCPVSFRRARREAMRGRPRGAFVVSHIARIMRFGRSRNPRFPFNFTHMRDS